MELIYVYDALCGWCYGFSPVIQEFHEKYKDEMTFKVISGGMITGDRIGPIGEVASYIKWAYKDVEQRTGVKFGSEFLNKTLEDGSAIFTSVPLAIALSVFKTYKTGNDMAFASALQKAIYYDGLEPLNTESYGKIAEKFEIDSETFVQQMAQPIYREKALKDFKQSRDLGVSGFPSVFIENSGAYYKVASGYVPFDQLEANILKIKNGSI